MFWQQILPPPPQPKAAFFLEQSQNALFDIKKMLDSLGVPFCLAHGTLLGIYRDGEILHGDKDVDVMLPWSVDRVWLAGELARLGCSVTSSPQELRSIRAQWCFAVRVPPHDMVVDIFFPKPENGKVWLGFTRGQYSLKIPVSPFGFSKVHYKGIEFFIPDQCDRHLCELYGEEWRFRTRNRKTFIINPNIVDEGHVRIAFALGHILGGLTTGNYKTAQGFTEQLLSIYDDPLLYDLRAYFTKLPFEITIFPPLPWQQQRLHYREVMGGGM